MDTQPNSLANQRTTADETPRQGAHLERPDDLAREQFSISDLTYEFGCTARALRFYEDEGLISPARVGLTRVYSKRDRARLAWIMRAKNVGFSLTEIREMIDLYDLDDGRVEILIEGGQKCVDSVVEWCRFGPANSRVDDIEIKEEEFVGEYENFDVRY